MTTPGGSGARRIALRTLDGASGSAEPMQGEQGCLLVTLDDGRSLVVPADVLETQPDGSALLRLEAPRDGESDLVIPVIREELAIGRRTIETGRGVRIRKQVREREEQVVQLLYREELDVQHVPKNQLVDQAPAVRYEGSTMVIPLCEEVLLLEKRLLLKEEVRVSRRASETRHAESVRLRSEHATVERFDEYAGAETPVTQPPPKI